MSVHPGGLPSRHYPLLVEGQDLDLYTAELGLNPHYIDASHPASAPDGKIAAMAADVLEAYEAISNKPLRVICGWSFGGVIAHEIAMRLEEQGRPVPVLMVIDSIAPVQSYKFDWISSSLSAHGLAQSSGDQRHVSIWFTQYLNALKGCNLKISKRDGSVLSEDSLINHLLEKAIMAGAFPEETSAAGFGKIYKEFRRGMQRNTRLLGAYTPNGSPQNIVLIRASRPFFPIFHLVRSMGWDALASKLDMHTISADHYQLIADPARMQQIARKLQSCLTRRAIPYERAAHKHTNPDYESQEHLL